MLLRAENHKIFGGSSPSSNSTEIYMRLNSVQNFMTIGISIRELSCKRTDGHADLFNSVLFFLSTQKELLDYLKRIEFP